MGFPSVMIDASRLPLDDNSCCGQGRVTGWPRPGTMSPVEAELGRMGGRKTTLSLASRKPLLTDPEAQEFGSAYRRGFPWSWSSALPTGCASPEAQTGFVPGCSASALKWMCRWFSTARLACRRRTSKVNCPGDNRAHRHRTKAAFSRGLRNTLPAAPPQISRDYCSAGKELRCGRAAAEIIRLKVRQCRKGWDRMILTVTWDASVDIRFTVKEFRRGGVSRSTDDKQSVAARN